MGLFSSVMPYNDLTSLEDRVQTKYVPLPSLKVGQHAVVERWDTLPHVMQERLYTLGLAPGETVRVERKMFSRGPVVIAFRGQHFALRYEDARHLLVREG
ncbi:MAG: FeoA family protein [Candidatus Carbobacillus sp.]|nr:FeoA family protein [Candidatus Carbobacillus sp.]